MLRIWFEPAGFGDVMRCIWSLATWLWPVPAAAVGLALRRTDTQIQQQALLGEEPGQRVEPVAIANVVGAFDQGQNLHGRPPWRAGSFNQDGAPAQRVAATANDNRSHRRRWLRVKQPTELGERQW